MGQAIERMEFSAADFDDFSVQLHDNLAALKLLLEQPDFGVGPGSLGAELEMYIIDADGKPLGKNREIQTALNNSQLTLELNRFNLEYNLSPFAVAGDPFTQSENELLQALQDIRTQAALFGGRIVPVGILPTLATSDFNQQTMTDVPRYHALAQRLMKDKGEFFTVHIKGQDELVLESNEITLEGANTSFQIHYRVNPDCYAETFNAVQLVTPLVLALASNSPTVFGHRLWHESRIPLFKKSIDARKGQLLLDKKWHQPPRVNFGNGWVREGAYELFAETVHLYPTLLPICSADDDLEITRQGLIPGLKALRLQQSTVWLWNRPIYDDSAGGHLRIELRALPSGPSVVDMIANAALAIGLAEGLRPHINELIAGLPFAYANYNFYRAAEHGIHCQVIWPGLKKSAMAEKPVLELLADLLPVAQRGLEGIKVSGSDIDKYLGIIERRIAGQTSGAQWQLDRLEKLQDDKPGPQAFHNMLEDYYAQSLANLPVAQWDK